MSKLAIAGAVFAAVNVVLSFLGFPLFLNAILGAAASFGFLSTSKKSKSGDPTRRVSFVTKYLLEGSFPASLNVPEPNIHGLHWFHEAPTVEELTAVLEPVVKDPKFFRFSRYGVKEGGKWIWRAYDFNIKEHVRGITVKSEEEILKFGEKSMLESFTPGKALWEMIIIKNEGKGRSAMMCRIHHGIGDGVAILGFFLQIFRDASGKKLPIPKFKKEDAGDAKPKKSGPNPIALALGAVKSFIKLATLPTVRPDDATLAKPSSLKFTRRRLVISEELPLDLLKDIKNKEPGTTINDVVVSMIAGAYRRYLEYRDDALVKKASKDGDLRFRALFPFSFPRDIEGSEALVNYWMLISMDMPVWVSKNDPLKRLHAVKKTIDAIKVTPEPYVFYAVQNFVSNILPLEEVRKTNSQIMGGHHLVYTNVPGPTDKVFICGKEVLAINGWVANVISQMLVASYNNKIATTLTCDDLTMSEPEKFVQFFNDEAFALAKIFGIDVTKYGLKPREEEKE